MQSWLAATETVQLAELKLPSYYLALHRKTWLSFAQETWPRIPSTSATLAARGITESAEAEGDPDVEPEQSLRSPLAFLLSIYTSLPVAKFPLWPWKALSLRE